MEKDDVLSGDVIRRQLEVLLSDPAFRSSKRSVEFLRFVVEQTLNGQAERIKERTIGIEVFGRDPTYDTNLDHVVRTAAIELRKRLAIYYGKEEHRDEVRMSLLPGSYVPRFTIAPKAGKSPAPGVPLSAEAFAASPVLAPALDEESAPDVSLLASGNSAPVEPRALWWPPRRWHYAALAAGLLFFLVLGILSSRWLHRETAQDLFWKPVMDTQGPVLLAMGDVPDGPPTSVARSDATEGLPVIHRTSSTSVPFADAATAARVLGVLVSRQKSVLIRRETQSSFSQLREGPVVLIGAFNNEWSLRLTRQLRYTLALDSTNHLIYIQDTQHPSNRSWSWRTDRSPLYQGGRADPPLEDYALISRIWNSETGHVLVSIGGLYTYGTEAAGEFLASPSMMDAALKGALLGDAHRNVQIVIKTKVTDGTPGPPQVLAVDLSK